MSWADHYIAKLQAGEVVEFRPRGNSMVPLIYSGNLVEVHPVTSDSTIVKNDIVLCRVAGAVYLHLVSAVVGKHYQISNNRGHVNGKTTIDKIYGVVNKVSP